MAVSADIDVLQTGELLHSYAIITVDAHKQLAWMHDRMPVSHLPLTHSVSTGWSKKNGYPVLFLG